MLVSAGGAEKIDSTEDVDLLTDTGCSKVQNTSSFDLLKSSCCCMYCTTNLNVQNYTFLIIRFVIHVVFTIINWSV